MVSANLNAHVIVPLVIYTAQGFAPSAAADMDGRSMLVRTLSDSAMANATMEAFLL